MLLFIDMERRQTMSSLSTDDEADYIVHSPPVPMKIRLQSFVGIPKAIDEKQINSENCSWCMLFI
jgi:hypothetical protein